MATTNFKQRLEQKLQIRRAMKWVGTGKTEAYVLRSVSPRDLRTLSDLEELTILLERGLLTSPLPRVHFGVDEIEKKVKGFCGGILEPCVRHVWKSPLRRRALRVRVAVASSIFLFRKVVRKRKLTDDEEQRLLDDYANRMSVPQDVPPSDFLQFCSVELKRQFKIGWDRGWDSSLDGFTLPTSACLERGRRLGGVRGGGPGETNENRARYEEFVSGVRDDLGNETEVTAVETGGKLRLVSKFPASRSFLSPLHNLIYGHLSKKTWLLRGEATEDAFSGFSRKEGEIFVSGDYESASDNLNIHLARFMIGIIQRRSRFVPDNVWRSAYDAQTNIINGKTQQRGQLMGSLLCFPLLCLANYLTFRWAIRRKGVPVRINGDDIVFRCRRSEAEFWMKSVGMSGLVLSKGKTLISAYVFSLNSTFFRSTVDGPELVPTVRSSCLFPRDSDIFALAGRVKGAYSGNGFLKDLVTNLVLRQHAHQIWVSQRSVRRGLGAQLSNRSLRMANLLNRESFYNSLPDLYDSSLPTIDSGWVQDAIPAGFSRLRIEGENVRDDPLFTSEMRELTFSRPGAFHKTSVEDKVKLIQEKTIPYVEPTYFRFAAMAGLSARETNLLKDRFVSTKRKTGKVVWRQDRIPGRIVNFVRQG